MKQFIKIILNKLLIFMLFFFVSCENDTQNDCVPRVSINRVLNLSLPLYSPLQNPGSWVYVDGEGAGTRGLIVINRGGGRYAAYDRNAPHMCPTTNSTLVVVDDIKIYCPNDEAEWNLYTGEPIKIANRPPTTYLATMNGNNLIITR